MKLNKFITQKLSISVLALTSFSAAFNTASCSNIDSLFFTIKGKDLEVTFCDRGASIYSIKYKDQYITYHPKDKNTFIKDDAYYGKVLGRVAGRIPDGKLTVNGQQYQLEVNEKAPTKNNSLHGGNNSFTARDFKHYISETNDWWKVSFNYVSPALEAGYPELLDSWFVYTIYKNQNIIDLNISATSTGITPVNLSTHPYFRLSNEGTILDHTLQIPADNIAKFEDNGSQVVIGTEPVSQKTPWDFRTPKKIGQDIQEAKEQDEISGGYDHIWKFNETATGLHTITLSNPQNNLTLDVTTDADAVIMYANCYEKPNQEMNPQGLDTLYGAITIEPIKFFQKDTIEQELNIHPGMPFTRFISYEIK